MRGRRKTGGRGEEEGEGGRTRKKGDEREGGIKEEGEGTSNGTQFVTSYSYSCRRVR